MKLKLLACSAFLLAGSTLYAQDYSFKVFGSKGNNTANGMPLKVGAKLKDSETVTVDGAYLGLSNTSGKTVEITSKGTYKIKDLVGQALKQANSSLTSKYAAFVVNELTKDDGETPTQNRSKYMNKTGSVDRGNDMVAMVPQVGLTESANNDETSTKFYSSNIALRWFLKPSTTDTKPEEIKGYRVFIMDMSEKVYLTQDVAGTAVALNLTGEVAQQTTLLVKAVPIIPKEDGANPSNDKLLQKEKGIVIHRTDEAQTKQIAADLKEICVNADETINKLIAARYFEENGLFIDAIAAYEEVIKMNPNQEKYKKMYQDFLNVNKLTKQAYDEAAQASTK